MNFFYESFGTALTLLASGDPATFSAIGATLKASFLALAVCVPVGLPLGFVLGYAEFPGKGLARMLVETLLAFPTVVIGLLVYGLLSRRGVLGDLELLFTVPGVAMGLALLGLPIVIALSAQAVAALDERLAPTLKTLGADRRQFLFATLVEARFGLLVAVVAAFGRVFSEVGIAMMVGGNIKWETRTITTAIALETNKGEFATGVALGLVLLALALIINGALSLLRRRG